MADKSREEAWKFYAQTYDATMRDWPGEMDFYKRLAAEAHTRGESVLELACGTGRVAIRLAREGICVVGLDVTPMAAMVSVVATLNAHPKGPHMPNSDATQPAS